MAKLNAALRLKAEIVAPGADFKKENESDLKSQQDTREKEENKPSENDKTEVTDNPSTTTEGRALARLLNSAYTPEDADPTIDTDKVQTARVRTKAAYRLFASRLETESDPLTMDESEDACLELADSTVDVDGLSGLEDGFAEEDEDGDNQTHPETNADVFTNAGSPSTADDNDTDYTEGIPLALDDQEVLSDADPTLWNMAQAPAGGTC